ncbi:MAG: hypothetical protein DRJ50_03925 [Actinobacteria bacterium]|nr:MAG: hypothetical protein DRJ50_03925 [Actinomycetota bacterium]
MATNRSRRLPILLLAFPLIAVACGSGADDAGPVGTASGNPSDASQSAQGGDPIEVEQIESTPPNVTISGLTMARGSEVDGAPAPLIDLNELRSGGPPPDGIPSVDEPKFLSPSEVDFLEENEPVLALDIDGDVRAYPVQILTWHEIVNDTVGGVPVSVTYCPLCNSAVAYDRRVDDQVVDFGTSGMLWNSALVMYDRQTETLWSHFTGEGIVGELTGTQLETFPVSTVPWGLWRDANPDGLVLSRDTGFDRSYGRNPYPGYDDVNNQPFLFDGEVDGQYTAMTRIVGIEVDDDALGVPLFALQEDEVITAEVGGTEIVVLWASGTASALDAGNVAGGDDSGATGVFIPVAEGQKLTFAPAEGGFVDDQTGSTWNILGTATDGELAGLQLEALSHVDTFWFAWSAFRPDTAIVE